MGLLRFRRNDSERAHRDVLMLHGDSRPAPSRLRRPPYNLSERGVALKCMSQRSKPDERTISLMWLLQLITLTGT